MTDRRTQYNPTLFEYDASTHYPWQVFDRVVVAMVTWNRREMTERAIAAIYRNAGMPFEMLVVDNASTDGTAEMLEAIAAKQGNLRLERNAENVGKSRAMRQLQALLPPNALLVFFDNDVEMLSSLFLVHVQKAFHAVRLATGSTDAVLGMRTLNCEEHGFRHAADVRRFFVPSAENGAPRSSFAAVDKTKAEGAETFAEQVLLGVSDFVLGQCWACPAPLLQAVPYDQQYPSFIGGVDGFASAHWAKRGIPMGYLENGPIARHLDWPYSEEKIALYTELAKRRATTDLSFLLWKLRRFFR